jgi:Na+/proline symporter
MFIFPPIFFFPGMAARIILPNLENTRFAYAAIILKILPIGLMGFILSGMLSATMSTLGSEYNTLSGVLTRDFYSKIINPNATEQREVLFGRIATLIIGIITMLLAILLNSLQGLTLMDIMFRFFSAFGPPIMIPLIAGLLTRRFNARGVIWGMIAGTLTGVILIIVNIILVQKYTGLMAANPRVDFWLRSGWNSSAAMLNITATLVGMWIGTKIKKTSPEEKERVAGFFADLDKPFEIEPEGVKPKKSPFGIIGLTLLMLGCAIVLISLIVLLFYHERRAFGLDLGVGLFIILLGGVLRLATRSRPGTVKA